MLGRLSGKTSVQGRTCVLPGRYLSMTPQQKLKSLSSIPTLICAILQWNL